LLACWFVSLLPDRVTQLSRASVWTTPVALWPQAPSFGSRLLFAFSLWVFGFTFTAVSLRFTL
jgi:hypothetical protein